MERLLWAPPERLPLLPCPVSPGNGAAAVLLCPPDSGDLGGRCDTPISRPPRSSGFSVFGMMSGGVPCAPHAPQIHPEPAVAAAGFWGPSCLEDAQGGRELSPHPCASVKHPRVLGTVPGARPLRPLCLEGQRPEFGTRTTPHPSSVPSDGGFWCHRCLGVMSWTKISECIPTPFSFGFQRGWAETELEAHGGDALLCQTCDRDCGTAGPLGHKRDPRSSRAGFTG